jgi:putative membrane protein
MGILITLLLNTIGVFVAAYILPGVRLTNIGTALVVSIVLALVNTFIRPIVFFLTLPITILTLGLFTFVIMGLMVILVTYIVPGFQVDNFLWAIAFALVLSVINAFIGRMTSYPH